MTDIEKLTKKELLNYLEEISQQLNNKALDQIPIAISKLQFEINKLKRALDEMANTLDLNLSLSIENYKFGKKEKIKEYFMKENTNE